MIKKVLFYSLLVSSVLLLFFLLLLIDPDGRKWISSFSQNKISVPETSLIAETEESVPDHGGSDPESESDPVPVSVPEIPEAGFHTSGSEKRFCFTFFDSSEKREQICVSLLRFPGWISETVTEWKLSDNGNEDDIFPGDHLFSCCTDLYLKYESNDEEFFFRYEFVIYDGNFETEIFRYSFTPDLSDNPSEVKIVF